jgi:hypothetical protein
MRTYQVPEPLNPSQPAVFDHGYYHFIFVDDNILAVERNILAVINTSVLLAYFLYGFPGDDRILPTLTEEKYEPFTNYHQEHMCIDINTRTLMVFCHIYK